MTPARVELLELPAAPAYQRMTFPHYRSLLDAPSPGTLALAAQLNGEPVGLALARIDRAQAAATLESLYVIPQQRRRGIATSLIARLEEELRQRGCSRVEAVYAIGGPSVPALEQLGARFDWAPPTPRSLIAKISQQDLMANDSWRAMAKLESPFSICSWEEVTPREREQIRKSQRERSWIPPGLMPFESEAEADRRTSLGLRHGEEVVGWIIMHELDPETVRVTCAWVREDLQRTSAGGRPLMAMALEAAHRSLAVGHRYGIWVVNLTQPKMARFTARVLAPYLISLQETRYTEKAL